MLWTLIIIIILYLINNQVIATVTKADNISAEFILTDNGSQLNLTWEKFINPSAVKIESLNETCKISCLIYPKDTTTLLIPPSNGNDSAKFIVVNDKCLFVNDCWYNITLKTMQGITLWNETLYYSECSQGLCLAKEISECPKIALRGKFISKDNMKINWSVNISQMTTNFSLQKTDINKIVISIYNLSAPELPWGGKHILIKNNSFSLNINSTETEIVNGFWDLHSEPMLLSKYSYSIQAYTDFNNCEDEVERLKLINNETVLTSILNDSKYSNSPIILETVPLLIVLIIALAIISLLVLYLIIIKNPKLKQCGKNTYHGIVDNPITLIPMQSNILYIERDNNLNNNDDYYEVSSNNITIIEDIDSGAFGKVSKGLLKHNNSTMIVAIKSLKKNRSYLKEDFLSEIETMKSVGKHEHIIELLGCCTKQQPMMMIMEYVGGGDLLKYLKRINRKQHRFSENNQYISSGNLTQGKCIELMFQGDSESCYITQTIKTSNTVRPSVTETLYTNLSVTNDDLDLILDCEELHNFALQIAKGMQYLEEKEITHRDLAARNILITEEKILKISDFGLSRNGIYVKNTRGEVPLRWLSIEAIQENFYSSKSDVWAFGIVLWEIGTLGYASPYPTVSNSDILKHLLSGNRLEKPEICSEKLYNLMTDCWKEDIAERPSFTEILQFLKPEGQNLYVQLNNFGSDYVFND